MNNRRWLGGGFLLTLFSSYGQTFYIALSSGRIRDEFGLSHGEFGTLFMAATLLGATLIPVVGRRIDSTRLENYAVFVLAGMTGSMLLIAVSNHVAVLFIALAGTRMFGQGLMPHAAMTATGRWFARNRGKAVSVVALGHQFGESVMPISFVAIAAVAGWRSSWLINAVILVVIVLPLVFVAMRTDRIPGAAEADGGEEGRQWSRAEALRDFRFWILLAGLLAPPVIGSVVFFHQVYLTEIRGWALALFAGSTPILSLFAIAATILTGVLIDRFGAIRLVPPMLLFLAVANIALGLVASAVAIVVYMALMGVTFGMFASVFGAILPEIYGTRHLGAIKGVATSAMVIGTALGPGLSGWAIDAGAGLPAIIIGLGAYSLAATPLMGWLAMQGFNPDRKPVA